MEKEKVFNELKRIFTLVIPNGIDVEKITMKNNITTDLGINSIGVIYLAIAIEEMYGIDMSEVTFTTFKTIEDVIGYILEKK